MVGQLENTSKHQKNNALGGIQANTLGGRSPFDSTSLHPFLPSARVGNGELHDSTLSRTTQSHDTSATTAFSKAFKGINNLVSHMLGGSGRDTTNGANNRDKQITQTLSTSDSSGSDLLNTSGQSTHSSLLQQNGYDTGNNGDRYKNPMFGNYRIDQTQDPLIGIIDSSFGLNEHGDQVMTIAASVNSQASFYLEPTSLTSNWHESLREIVDIGKTTNRPVVANLSFGPIPGINPDKFLTSDAMRSLDYAEDHGVPVVISSGNDFSDKSGWEKAAKKFDNIILVGATTLGWQPEGYSNSSPELDLVASGESPLISGEGTSFAAPYVTGVISRMLTANPLLRAPQIEAILKATAIDIHAPGRDDKTGAGFINPWKAIDWAMALADQSSGTTGSASGGNRWPKVHAYHEGQDWGNSLNSTSSTWG